jgi:hypothetical protein
MLTTGGDMGRQVAKGTAQLATQLDESLLAEFRRWVSDRGETLRAHLELALRRHMDSPPPPLKPEAPPLPPMGSAPAAKPKGKKR